MYPGGQCFGAATFSSPTAVSWGSANSNTGSAVDTESSIIVYPVVEAGSAVDASSELWAGNVSDAEAGSAQDTVVSALTLFIPVAIVENLAGLDEVTVLLGINPFVSEVGVAIETDIGLIHGFVAATEAGSVSETESVFKGYFVVGADNIPATALTNAQFNSPQSRAEILTLTSSQSELLTLNAERIESKSLNLQATVSVIANFSPKQAEVLFAQDAPAGGTGFAAVSRAEAAFAVDQPSSAQTSAAARVESGAALTTQGGQVDYAAVRLEAGSAVDTVANLFQGRAGSTAEVLFATETPTGSNTTASIIAELLAALDTSSKALTTNSASVEAGSAADTSSTFVSVVVAEVGNASNVVNGLLNKWPSTAENLAAADSVSLTRILVKSQSERVAIVDFSTSNKITASASVEILHAAEINYGSKNGLGNVFNDGVVETLAAVVNIDAIRAYADLITAIAPAQSGTYVTMYMENGMSTRVRVDDITLQQPWDAPASPTSPVVTGFNANLDPNLTLQERVDADLLAASHLLVSSVPTTPTPRTTASVDLGSLPTQDVSIATNTETEVQLAQTKSPNFYKVTEVADKDKAGASIIGVKISDQKP